MTLESRHDGYGPMTPAEDPAWAGWFQWGRDPFEAFIGPLFCRYDEAGVPRTAFRAAAHHMNVGDFMHGGALMTFADYTLFFVSRQALDDAPAVTATLNTDFVGAVPVGAMVEGTGEVIKAGRSMLFARGLLSVAGEPVLNFSGVIKRSGKWAG